MFNWLTILDFHLENERTMSSSIKVSIMPQFCWSWWGEHRPQARPAWRRRAEAAFWRLSLLRWSAAFLSVEECVLVLASLLETGSGA